MIIKRRHIERRDQALPTRRSRRWTATLTAMLTLLLCGCYDYQDETIAVESAAPVLNIYVYSPESPIVTRAGTVSAIGRESEINELQIWVFTHDEVDDAKDGLLVGYLEPDVMPTATDGAVYQMQVDNSFVNASPRPNVDVFVVANATSLGLSTPVGSETTRAELEAKLMETPFGVSSPTTTIPTKGLPMTGVLRNQTVVGDAPVLRIGNYDNMAKLNLKRMVSKVRFVFCMAQGNEDLNITGISINGGTFPKGEYLFLGDGETYHIDNNSYLSLSAVTPLPSAAIAGVKKAEDPTAYVYNDQEAQAYEELINGGVNGIENVNNGNPTLSASGPYYFRETDKKVSGTITYQVGNDAAPVQEASFAMTDDNGFSRNHSWIVYAYYEGLSGLRVVSVNVTPWVEVNYSHTVYNW